MSEIVSRAFDALECLAAAPSGLSLGELCERIKVPKNLGHRTLGLLIERGYVEQDETSRAYRLTLQLPLLGFRYIASTGVYDVLEPMIVRVAELTGEYVTLGAVEGDNIIWIANTLTAKGALRCEPILGPVVNLHATACGLAWLATLKEERAVEIVLQRGFASASNGKNPPRTVTEFLRELSAARERGYGLALETAELGVHAIAVAFSAGSPPSGPAVGTLSIAGPAVRLTEQKLKSLVPLLKQTTETMGALWPMRTSVKARSAAQGFRAALRAVATIDP